MAPWCSASDCGSQQYSVTMHRLKERFVLPNNAKRNSPCKKRVGWLDLAVVRRRRGLGPHRINVYKPGMWQNCGIEQ